MIKSDNCRIRRLSAWILSVIMVIFASAAYPACKVRAAALEITGSVAISALIAYLGASGITYSADGGDASDIINSISTQISPYINSEYGSEQAWVNDIRALSSPLGTLNGGLSISKPLCDMYEGVRDWLVSNVFTSQSSVTVDHIAGVDSGIYTCTIDGATFGTYAITNKVINTGPNVGNPNASWYGSGCYVEIPSSYFGSSVRTIVLSAMPATQNITVKVSPYSSSSYSVDMYDGQTKIHGANVAANNYLYIVLSRVYQENGITQTGKYGIALGSAYSATSGFLGKYSMPGALSDITTPSYTLTSDYNSSSTAPVVSEGTSFVIDTGADLISGIDTKLDDILSAVQSGEAVYPDSRTEANAANVAPAVYSEGSQYALDLTSLFPFCIPWDIDRGLRLFAAEPVTPSISWDVPLPNGGVYTLELDLHDFDGVAGLARKLELILWVVGLAVATKYLIKW